MPCRIVAVIHQEDSMHSFDKIAPRGRYAQVVEQLEERILRGEFPANELLPSEAALAEQLGVGRRALREA
ncbi:MAG: FadR/GntR family transcriptional regulator, partial [Kiritimatiellia bacterium]